MMGNAIGKEEKDKKKNGGNGMKLERESDCGCIEDEFN